MSRPGASRYWLSLISPSENSLPLTLASMVTESKSLLGRQKRFLVVFLCPQGTYVLMIWFSQR